jgi:hypothetical protein
MHVYKRTSSSCCATHSHIGRHYGSAGISEEGTQEEGEGHLDLAKQDVEHDLHACVGIEEARWG